jgi:hypothetical protein
MLAHTLAPVIAAAYGQARTADHRGAQHHDRVSSGREEALPNQAIGTRTGFSLRAISSRSRSRTAAGCLRACPRAPIGGRTAPMLFSGRLKRRCNGGDTVTATALHVVTPLPWPIELGEHVRDEEADGLRLLIEIGACSAFVAVLRNHARIIFAHVNRQSPKSARCRSRSALIRSANVAMVVSLRREDGARKPFPRPERCEGHGPDGAASRKWGSRGWPATLPSRKCVLRCPARPPFELPCS